MTFYQLADVTTQWYDNKFGWSVMKPNTVVLHTTEGFGWPGYSSGQVAPTITANPDIPAQRLRFRQHFHNEHSARALENWPGGVETNTLNVIQIELVGTCDSRLAVSWGTRKAGVDYIYWPTAPYWALAGLANWLVYLHKTFPAFPLRCTVPFSKFPWGDGVRMTGTQWWNYSGICGHQHVPENTHGDPGLFPIQRLLTICQMKEGAA